MDSGSQTPHGQSDDNNKYSTFTVFDLMIHSFSVFQTQLTSRLQETDSKQEMEEDKSRRRSLSVVSDRSQSSQCSQSSQTSQLSSSSRRKQQSPVGDPVVSATLRQLQQLGVNVDEEALTESDRNRVRTVESTRYRTHLKTK